MSDRVVIVGAGPGGLAAAGALTMANVPCRIVSEGRPGDSWRAHYDRLHLHTARGLSGLPGLPMPRRYGMWVARDQVVEYLESYAKHHALEIETGVRVERIERVGDGYRLGPGIEAKRLVVATGYNHTPFVPMPTAAFVGRSLHTSAYKNPKPFAGMKVVVVGSGNSGAEIAQDLAEHGVQTSISIRTPPSIVARDVLGFPSQVLSIVMRRWPPALADQVAAVASRLGVGDLRPFGLPRAPAGAFSYFHQAAIVPILDVGFSRQLKQRKIRVVPGVTGVFDRGVVLADGNKLEADAILWATGFKRGLEPLVGHLGVLDDKGLPKNHGADESAPGLHFIGFTNPISGNLREIAIDARKIAERLRAR